MARTQNKPSVSEVKPEDPKTQSGQELGGDPTKSPPETKQTQDTGDKSDQKDQGSESNQTDTNPDSKGSDLIGNDTGGQEEEDPNKDLPTVSEETAELLEEAKAKPLSNEEKMAETVKHFVDAYVSSINTLRVGTPQYFRVRTAFIRQVLNIATIADVSEFVAAMDILMKRVKLNSGTGSPLSDERVFERFSDIQLSALDRNRFQFLFYAIRTTLDSQDPNKHTNFVKDLSKDALLAQFPEQVGSRLYAYFARYCGAGK